MSEPFRGAAALFDEIAARPAPVVPSGPGQHRRRRPRWPFVLAALAVLALALAGGAWFTVRQAVVSYDHNIERFADPFTQLPADQRPASTAHTGTLNVLLLGSDSRISAGDPAPWSVGAQRTDAIMLVHVQADRKAAYVVSIPRDSWVPIPGHGTAKINAAFSWGGPALMVRTVESVTGVHVDHVVIADFDGFKQLTDDLGGVDIKIPKATHDERAFWTAGVHHMTGAQALDYVRQRHNLPGGDFDRVKRQQTWIKVVVRKLVASGTMSNPVALNRALTTLSKSVATDAGFDMDTISGLVSSLADMDPGELRFLSMPTAGGGVSSEGEMYVKVDKAAAGRLFGAVEGDKVRQWIRTYRPDMLPEEAR
jgi:LCP family protein required for cell wall assembly